MDRDRSGHNSSLNRQRRPDATSSRALIVALSLMAIGALLLFFADGSSRAALQFPADLWQDIAETSIVTEGEREELPSAYRTVRLDMASLRRSLAAVPIEFSQAANEAPFVITMPMPDGAMERFRIVESPMLEEKTAEHFPEIKNYSGQGLDDPAATMRFDLTINGFHAIILSTRGAVFISPYARGDDRYYISYFFHDDPRGSNNTCAVQDIGAQLPPARSTISNTINQGFLRTYFLAAAATFEYTEQFRTSPTDTADTLRQRAMGDINTTIMMVNAIYNRDLSVRLTIIANPAIIFTVPDDGYTSGDLACDSDPATLDCLTEQNQSILDGVIGSDNYDIGHVFDRGDASGGGAGIGDFASVCAAGRKGKGSTGGRTNFVIAGHEMGHQFGASHTFNSEGFGACASLGGSPQRTAASAYEPGSGSSLMSYGGTCADATGTANLQGNRDLFFNASSIEQILLFTTSGGGSSCPVVTPTGNNGLSMSFSQEVTVPAQTPFRLFVLAEDIDPSTSETVSWEEHDLGPPSPPEADDGARPIFRVYPPTQAQHRNFPRLDYILNNANNPPATYNCGTAMMPVTCLTGEVLPSVNRTMMLKAVARDNDPRGGAINIVTVRVNIINTLQPFQVTVPGATPEPWTQGAMREVRWLTGDTEHAPINCQNVKITLSVDGGQTFPIVLASSTPNDGVHNVLIPEDAPLTSQARVMVEAIIPGNSHTFFDISNVNFVIDRIVVTSTADSGPGTLRQAILDANSNPNLTRIAFDIREGIGVETIRPLSALPLITSPVILDGWSQGGAGYSGPPLIEINGASADPVPGFITNGLTISAGNSTVNGLIINRFSGSGIDIRTNGGNKISGCYIGTNANGTGAQANGGSGILIDNTPNNEIGRRVPGAENIISGNNIGIRITGINATGNEIRNNYIGTNGAGSDIGNTLDGILIEGAPNNLIGGTRSAGGIDLPTGNVISGNGAINFSADGIEITGAGASGNVIQANLIGLNPSGVTALGNLGNGILIINAPNTIIGGASAERNVISGNIGGSGGIVLLGVGSSGTSIQGNYLGTTADGTAAIRNNATNIFIESANNLINGNLISGFTTSGGIGIHLAFGGATGNLIQANYIGTNADGTAPLSNVGTGIEVRGGANNNIIGGAQAGLGNVISGNSTAIFAISTSNTVIQGNFIGTNPQGTSAVANVRGVFIDGGSNHIIGGPVAGARNIISGNGTGGNDHGIALSNTSGCMVQGNFIGTDAAGTAALGNGGNGVHVFNGTNNTIGGSTPAVRNIISANRGSGIVINATGTVVQGNYIGTDVNGTADLGNSPTSGASGIDIQSGSNNTIGGAGAGAGNIIAFSGCFCFGIDSGSGVRVFTSGNSIRGNSIHSNAELGIDLSGGSENAFRVTANDNCDGDAGPNNLQNFPVLTSATTSGGSTTITGTLNSTASATFTIDFYANAACDPSSHGEGRTFIGSTMTTTDASCNASFMVTLPVGVTAGSFITATATDASGNTSEFSACQQAADGGPCLSLSSQSQSFAATGGTGSVNVSGSAACAWTAISNNPGFITVTSGAAGNGDGTVAYSVAANAGTTPRNGTITIAGQTFTVFQGIQFADVPQSHPFFTEIGKLSARGVTLGCDAANYCPDLTVTRQQMAAFIIRALGDFNPPPPAMQRFSDVPPSNPFYAFIEQMAIRQITLGCGAGIYCPDDPVLRDQMAAFIIRALHPPGYIPPQPAMQRFPDVPPTNAFYAHIEEMAVRGVTLGCGGGNYCPTLEVSRGQMAAFIVRAFNL